MKILTQIVTLYCKLLQGSLSKIPVAPTEKSPQFHLKKNWNICHFPKDLELKTFDPTKEKRSQKYIIIATLEFGVQKSDWKVEKVNPHTR